jgi:hypothetical protein
MVILKNYLKKLCGNIQEILNIWNNSIIIKLLFCKVGGFRMKNIYLVCIDYNISQPIGDEIDSIWTSKSKANKRKNELIKEDEIYNLEDNLFKKERMIITCLIKEIM